MPGFAVDSRLDAWSARVGAAAAAKLRSHRRLVGAAWILTATGFVLLLVGVLVAMSSGTGPADAATFATVAVLCMVGGVSPIFGYACGTVARMYRYRAEGLALRALLPRNPSLSAHQLGGHLRRIDDFDAWASRDGVTRPSADDAPLADGTWEADTVRPILPGTTASKWQAIATVVTLAGLTALIAMGVFSIHNRTPSGEPTAAADVLLTLAAALFVGGAVVALVSRGRFRQEYQTGYTTLVFRTRSVIQDWYTGVDLVDPKTGYLLRPAAGLPLTANEFGARTDRVRADHPGIAPTRLGLPFSRRKVSKAHGSGD